MDLRAWRSQPARAAVLTDFDGTLAPIVSDPAGARAVDGALEVLGALVRRMALVGVVSGRSVGFLTEHLPVPGLALAGLYGLERAEGDRIVGHPEAEPWRPTLARLTGEARAGAPAGIRVEDKGLTVTLHARARPEAMSWIDGFVAERAVTAGLVAHPGKLSVEIRPPVPMDKGVVVEELVGDLDPVLYLGDDLGDLPAFAALARLRAAGVTTLAVAAGGDELPAEVAAAADLIVEGPAGVLSVLRRLV